jgi:hypothetical protein
VKNGAEADSALATDPFDQVGRVASLNGQPLEPGEACKRRVGFVGAIIRAFEKHGVLPCFPDGQVAQLVEQRTENPCVGGSIPPLATTISR